MTFKREERYLVLKLKEVDTYLNEQERDSLIYICNKLFHSRKDENKERLKCVVVEHDWRCYEDVWKLVEQEYNEDSILS